MTRAQVGSLIQRDGECCHYCNRKLNKKTGTVDHVVPRSLGGRNGVDNYVLACNMCNSLRQSDIRWCDCKFCGPRIAKLVASQLYVDSIFDAMVGFNKPVIKRMKKSHVWRVYLHGVQHNFETFDQAIHFATTN